MIVAFSSFSQRWKLGRFEMVYGVGASNYFGDIGGADDPDKGSVADMDFKYTRPVLTLGLRYRIQEKISIKGDFSYAYIYGSDIGSYNESRAYSFSSNLFELHGHIEYDFLSAKQYSNYSARGVRDALQKFNYSLNAYAFVGLGGVFFLQKAKDDLATSERFVNNKHLALSIPIGIGVKYPLNSRLYVGFELGGRFITSDYIDGFAPEASNALDIYYFSVLNVSYKIKKRSFRRRKNHF